MGRKVDTAEGYDIEALYGRICPVIESQSAYCGSQGNLMQVLGNLYIGRMIVEDEVSGDVRARYGRNVQRKLSARLTSMYGRGFSVDNLENMRTFYLTFGKRISEETYGRFRKEKFDTVAEGLIQSGNRPFFLSWSHYLVLMQVQDERERSFYEAEAYENQWEYRVLQKCYRGSFYERLLCREKRSEVLAQILSGA